MCDCQHCVMPAIFVCLLDCFIQCFHHTCWNSRHPALRGSHDNNDFGAAFQVSIAMLNKYISVVCVGSSVAYLFVRLFLFSVRHTFVSACLCTWHTSSLGHSCYVFGILRQGIKPEAAKLKTADFLSFFLFLFYGFSILFSRIIVLYTILRQRYY